MPFIFRHLAVMPDVHLGKGSTIGSVIPTRGAIIPAAVGVDIGCGMIAVRTTLTADRPARQPARPAQRDRARGAARAHRRPRQARRRRVGEPAASVDASGPNCSPASAHHRKTPAPEEHNNHKHLGTLGTGNHFIEVCLDEAEACGSCCTRVRAASATPSAPSSSNWRRQDMRAAHRQPARPRPRLLRGRQHALRRLRRGGRLGAGLCAPQPRRDDGQRDRRRAPRDRQAVRGRRGGRELPPQLRPARNPFRRRHLRHAQGRGVGEEGRTRHHPRLDGREELYRARPRQRGILLLVQPRRRAVP
jgi:hypothetical protein